MPDNEGKKRKVIITKMSLIFTIDDYFDISPHKRIEEELWVLQHSLTNHDPERVLMREQNFNWILGAIDNNYFSKIYIVDGYSSALYRKLKNILGNIATGFGMKELEDQVKHFTQYTEVDTAREFNNAINGIEQQEDGKDTEIVNCIKQNITITDYMAKRFANFRMDWEKYLDRMEQSKKQKYLLQMQREEMRKQYEQYQKEGMSSPDPSGGNDGEGGSGGGLVYN